MAKYDGWFMTFNGIRGIFRYEGYGHYKRLRENLSVLGDWTDDQIEMRVATGVAKLEAPKTRVLKDYFCL